MIQAIASDVEKAVVAELAAAVAAEALQDDARRRPAKKTDIKPKPETPVQQHEEIMYTGPTAEEIKASARVSERRNGLDRPHTSYKADLAY